MFTYRSILVILTALTLSSCSGKTGEEKSSKDIVKDYATTLSTAPDKARDTAEKAGKRDAEVGKSLEELDK